MNVDRTLRRTGFTAAMIAACLASAYGGLVFGQGHKPAMPCVSTYAIGMTQQACVLGADWVPIRVGEQP